MTNTPPLVEDPNGTQEAIIVATYHALCEHGYSDLTIQRIGDHLEKSTSLIYHHYDGKDELLLDFLEYMLDEFEDSVPEEQPDGAVGCLNAILDSMVAEATPAEHPEFVRAMAELRAQAAHDERYRDHFTHHDQVFRDRLADVIRAGIDDGLFEAVDPDRVAALLATVITGSLTQQATTGTEIARDAREELRAYVERRLLAEGSEPT